MPDVRIIHKGFGLSKELRRRVEEWGSEATVGTARLGPEAMIGDGTPDLVITDSEEICDFWQSKTDVDFVGDPDTPAPSTDTPEVQNENFGLDVGGTGAAQYRKVERGNGWFDVEGPGGEPVNDSALREDEADALIDDLT